MLCLKSYRLYSKKQRFCLFKEGYILKLMDGLTYLSCQYIHPIMIFDAKYIFIHSGFFSGMSWRFYAKSWHFSNPQWNILARKMACYDVFISVYTFTFVKKVEKVTAQYISGAPAVLRAVKRSPILIWERKGNPSMSVLMVIMASGIARGRVRTTTTTTTATESCKMAAILQILGWQRHAALVYVYFADIGHACYDQWTPVKTRYLLTSITWPYRGLKCTAYRGHVFWSWHLTKCWFSIGSRVQDRSEAC